MRIRPGSERRGALVLALLLAALAAVRHAPESAAPGPPPPRPVPVSKGDPRIDINRADARTLTALPGIGPVLAERIIRHRARHGPFRSVDELAAVRGIGPRLIERIRARARAGGPADTLLR